MIVYAGCVTQANHEGEESCPVVTCITFRFSVTDGKGHLRALLCHSWIPKKAEKNVRHDSTKLRMDQMQTKNELRKRKDTSSTTEGQPLVFCHWDFEGEWHGFWKVRWSVGNLQWHPEELHASCSTERQNRGRPLSFKSYSEELKAFAMTLQFYSSNAYDYVRETFDLALPHPQQIRSWYTEVDGDPGFTQTPFEALSYKESARTKLSRRRCYAV